MPYRPQALCLLLVLLVTHCSCGERVTAIELVEVVKKVEHAVVRVDTDQGFGSGVIVTENGVIFTNFHVIDEARKITITLRSGEAIEVDGYIAVDPSRDLAILRADKPLKFSAIPISSDIPAIGEKVAAFGNPKGFSFTTSEGIVSAVRPGMEVARIIGDAAYRRLGYGDNATWVQTTTPISSGNSGGPLVNMKVEVIGLNTWTRVDGQNLNFAISAKDIRELLEMHKNAQVTPLTKLPRRLRPNPGVPGNPGAPGQRPDTHIEVALPNGRTFSTAIFEQDQNALRSQFQDESNSKVLIKHSNGHTFAAASHKSGVLHGVTIGNYENKERMVLVNYYQGKRHGLMKTWDISGRPMFYAQYTKGKRHGFTCLYDDGVLSLVTDYKNDEPQWFQAMLDDKVLEGFPTRADAEKNKNCSARLKRGDEVEANLKANEIVFRKQVKDFETQQRKARATALAPQKRNQMQARENQRAAQDDAFMRELSRRAWGR